MTTELESIYTGEYFTVFPSLVKWTDQASHLFMNSPIKKCLAVLSKIRLFDHYDSDLDLSDSSSKGGEQHGGLGCIRIRVISFTNKRDESNPKYLKIYMFYYSDYTYRCRVSHNGDILDESCLDRTIRELIFPQIKSARSEA